MKNQIVVISDVHIGTNYPTCWYQQSVHEPYLITVLDWIIANSANIKEFVILGDLFDFWTYPPHMAPPTIDMILQANPNIFGPGGKLSQVLTALDGNVTYLCGNHDMNVTQADLNKISNRNYQVKKAADVYSIYETGLKTTFTHGHLTTMFNAPDEFNTRFGGLPLGHFVTRAVAYLVQNTLKPGQTAADLPGQGSPYGFDTSSFLLTRVNPFDPSFAETFLNYIIEQTKIPRDMPVVLANGQSITIGDASAYYRNLWSQWSQKYGGLYALKAAWADYDGSYMGWFAQKRAFETNTDLVVMGHTHIPKLGLTAGSLVSYVNSGFECVSKPDFGQQAFTFAVITQAMDERSSLIPTANLYQVVNHDGSYDIEPTFAGPAWIVNPKLNNDYSCYVQITNYSQGELKRDAYDAKYGDYVVEPPETIPSGFASLGRFWLQDVKVGTEGSVRYTINGGPRSGNTLNLDFSCAYFTSLFSNSCSGADFETKSGAASDWSAGIAQGNPFYISFNIYP